MVMMATYKGERWVGEQIDSILGQEGVDVTLRICDDQSPDGTFSICKKYANRFPNVVVTRNETNLGVNDNFMQMLYEDDAENYDYYAFSDQDDLWMPNKLSAAVDMIEKMIVGEEPALYYCDLINVEGSSESRELYRFTECERHPATVLLRNYINGCVMVFNHALARIVQSYRPTHFPRMHDVWLHMAGRFCGTVIADTDHAYMKRRITGNNVVGKTTLNPESIGETIKLALLALKPYERVQSETARLFYDGYSDYLKPEGRRVLEEFLHYRDSLDARIRYSGSRSYWIPSPEALLRMRVGVLLGFY
ncbi:glycosyltransferase [Parafannyhessea sp. LCP19S3_B1]|uniref:glycosyltransferase n=1 Tax=Parafannyhessea sp. LCP19S3_B1 TaxID=3438795 RepID=UPI003F94B120